MVHIHYSSGRVLEGILLSLGDRAVRVTVRGSDDAVELRLINGVWVSEDCEVVRIAFVERFLAAESAGADQRNATPRFPATAPSAQRVM